MFSLVVHGHFYQPPRENPWTDDIEREPSAAPSHDWNARIHAECYRANAFARIHGRAGRIQSIVNNYARLSFNFGPTLARWIERKDPRTHARLVEADVQQRRRLGFGGAMAQAYAHPIVPLCSPADRRTQLLWGLADFRRRFGRPADGLWLPETAANVATLATLIDLGVQYTILAPEQVAAVRARGEEWTSVDRDTVDTGRAYRWFHPDGSGRTLSIAVFDGPLSRGVAFGDATRDAATFIAMARASAARSRVSGQPLVLCASDGELFGHHKKFADLNLAFTNFVEGPKNGIEPTNLGAYLAAHPPTWEMALAEGPDGKGTSWSCAHGVGRWWRDCGCTMVPPENGWNQAWRTPLRAAMDTLQAAAADFYEGAAAELLVDPWGARDAYGEVVDAPLSEVQALLSEFGTGTLLNGGEEARNRARLLLEMQRATLLMYASCGWYFDDVAGLEASLILRLAAHAADLMNQAGGTAPVEQVLDILADAKSNELGGITGADVFRRGAADRVTPARAMTAVALALAASPDLGPEQLTPGHEVEVVSRSVVENDQGLNIAGHGHVMVERTGRDVALDFTARWNPRTGFAVTVDGDEIPIGELPRETRYRLFPLLLPRLVHAGEEAARESGSRTAPHPAQRIAVAGGGGHLAIARVALVLGKEVLGTKDFPEDAPLRLGYAQLLLQLLTGGARAAHPGGAGTVLVELLEAAGSALAPGTPERSMAEEMVAQRLEEAGGTGGVWSGLAERLGFVTAGPTSGSKHEIPAGDGSHAA